MSLSSKGLDFIKKYEKLSLTPYKDQAGYETIGYGHKILPGEDFSKGITKAQALDLLSHDAQGGIFWRGAWSDRSSWYTFSRESRRRTRTSRVSTDGCGKSV
jgi:hypothetical protein